MENALNRQSVFPLPFREEKECEVRQKPRQAGMSLPKRARDEDFPSQSSYQMSGLRMVALVVVLFGVTLSMVASFVFLFSGTLIHLQLPLFPSSLSLIGLVVAGAGVGILLWILLTSLLNHSQKRRSAQKNAPLLTRNLFAMDGKTTLPPEPMDRQTGALFSSPRDQWNAFEWKGEPQRETETLEVLHMRQRLRTFRWYDADDFPGDDRQEKRYQIKKVQGRIIVQRKTDALIEEGVDVLFYVP